MNKKLMRQRFTSGLLVVLSVTSMALLGLQFLTTALGSPGSTMDMRNFDSRLASGGFYWWTDIVEGLVALVPGHYRADFLVQPPMVQTARRILPWKRNQRMTLCVLLC